MRPLDGLLAALEDLGVRAAEGTGKPLGEGFPELLHLPDGRAVLLDLPRLGSLGGLDPREIGIAIMDHVGIVTRSWGIAERSPHLALDQSNFDGDLGPFLESVYRGDPGALFLEGYRYYATLVEGADDEPGFVFVLVTNALDEAEARRQAGAGARSTTVLKRVGKALTANQKLKDLSVAAVSEIAASANLAAALLWVRHGESSSLSLDAAVGVNRRAQSAIRRLDLEDGFKSVAEIAAVNRRTLFLRHVSENLLTSELESAICYLPPGGIAVLPLQIQDRLIGVLELIGREDDRTFVEDRELFSTLAEHLSLALNSAILYENMEQLASFDPLTGVANHRTMQDFLHRRLREAERRNDPVAVMMIDVDHFRNFNEEEGHDAGDEVLRLVVDAMKSCLRAYDLAARYGGEEFTVIMPNVNQDFALAAAERIRARVEQTRYVTRSGRDRCVTVSIGVAVFPDHATDETSVIKCADVALFKAKRGGRNRVEMFSPDMAADVERRSSGLEPLRRWLAPEDAAAAEDLWRRVEGPARQLMRELRLSRPQEELLEAMVRLWPTYDRARAQGKPYTVGDFEAAEETRGVAPSLASVDERWDGHGPRQAPGHLIPLLARVLAALLGLAGYGGRRLDDQGRYDPEVLAALASTEAA
jgi:diguanylate cyclase (GGDEF)-like protein